MAAAASTALDRGQRAGGSVQVTTEFVLPA